MRGKGDDEESERKRGQGKGDGKRGSGKGTDLFFSGWNPVENRLCSFATVRLPANPDKATRLKASTE